MTSEMKHIKSDTQFNMTVEQDGDTSTVKVDFKIDNLPNFVLKRITDNTGTIATEVIKAFFAASGAVASKDVVAMDVTADKSRLN